MKVYVNDRFVDATEARVSVLDRGFLYGDGVFETLRAYGGRIFRLEDHLDRLEASARALALRLPVHRDGLARILGRTLRENALEHAMLRLTVTRGPGGAGLDAEGAGPPTLVAACRRFQGYPSETYERGVRLCLARLRKVAAEALDPAVKSLNFLPNVLARMEARTRGADEAVLLNAAGSLAEGTVSNVFFVRRGRLFTPSLDAGILPGVTRKVVLELARGLGIEVEEGLFPAAELDRADEIFVTSTGYEVMPAGRWEDRDLTPGPVTMRLLEAFRERVGLETGTAPPG